MRRSITRSLGLLLGVIAAVPVRFAAQAAPEPAVDACALLDAREIAVIIGAPVTGGERHDSGAVTRDDSVSPGTYSATCLWRLVAPAPVPLNPDLPLGGASFVILNVMQWPRGTGDARRFLDGFVNAAKDGTIGRTPVPLAIGDGALWWGDGVAAYKGNRSFGISVHLVGGRERERAIEEKLARKLALRL